VVLLTARKVIFTASQVFCEAVKDYQLCFKTAIILNFEFCQMLYASIFTNVAFCFQFFYKLPVALKSLNTIFTFTS